MALALAPALALALAMPDLTPRPEAHWAERIALGVLMAGFAWGTLTHALDYVYGGWLPYRFGPPAMNAFWNALVVLDATVLTLFATGRRRAALVAGAALMVADVAINSYAAWGLGLAPFTVGVAFQAAFLGFLLGALPFLWRRAGAATIPSHGHGTGPA